MFFTIVSLVILLIHSYFINFSQSKINYITQLYYLPSMTGIKIKPKRSK